MNKEVKNWIVSIGISVVVVGGSLYFFNQLFNNDTVIGSGVTVNKPAKVVYKGSSEYPYDVGKPGPGDKAPEFSLPATNGKTVSLSDYKSKTVLLFIQEGLMCQPCFRQSAELQKDMEWFKKDVGVDEILVMTIDPVDSLILKAKADNITLPILSDIKSNVSKSYDALKYGMMGGSYPGHTFILIDGNGVITWRGDYGGAPKFTMYLPNYQIIEDIKKELTKT